MANGIPLPYLSDETIGRVIADLRGARADLLFQINNHEGATKDIEREYMIVNTALLTVTAERTARMALTPEMRFKLAQDAKR